MSRNRTETWLALIVVGIGPIPVAIMGLWAYMSATATPLHPNPKDAPSVIHSTPPPKWADAVEQGRQIVRLGLTDQNLPGLSVAVGVGGNIVWAEGFGWANLEKRVPVAPETKFRIGTASTAITSAAVGLLLEEGRLGRARPTIRAGPEPASFSPLRPTSCASVWQSTAASCCNPPRCNCSRRRSD